KILVPFFNEINYSDDAKNYFTKKEINIKEILKSSVESLENIDNNSFNTENIEKELRGIAAKLQLNLKIIAEVLRIAIWGGPASPPLFETIEIIGKKATLSRLRNYLKSIA
ncbi:MAG: hypothetical protein ACYDIA_05775, partial [Candidatus Humimicrobiaceae bacterium]